MAHWYTKKEDHLLSGPSELQPLEAVAHRDTRKEAHLLSRPSKLQPTEDSETQKFDSAHVQLPRQEYSRLTETEKAKFQDPFIYNDDRNFVRHNSVDKFSPNLVFMTTPNTSVSNSVSCRKKGRKRGKCRDSRNSGRCSRRTCTCTYSRRTCTCTCNKTCCMHVDKQQSQTYKTGEPPALREVKHPHRDRTSVSRSPSIEQEVLSQFSGYSEEIEHFTRDPYKSHLKSCLQSTEHASKKQEVNTCINCEHSYRHMNDHLTQNTGRMQ